MEHEDAMDPGFIEQVRKLNERFQRNANKPANQRGGRGGRGRGNKRGRGRGRGQNNNQQQQQPQAANPPPAPAQAAQAPVQMAPAPAQVVAPAPQPNREAQEAVVEEIWEGSDDGMVVQEDERISLDLPFSLKERDVKIAESDYPAFKFHPRGTMPHSHPHTAIQRMLADDFIVNKFAWAKGICDVGGNPGRHAKLKHKNVWCCCPITQPKDDVDMVFRGGRMAVCEHTVTACDCGQNQKNVIMEGTLCMLRSADEICELVHESNNGIFVGQFYRFKDIMGSINHNEIVYTRNELEVVMHTQGSNAGYKLPDETWVFTQPYHKHRNGRMAMAWDEIGGFGNLRVIVFTKSSIDRDTSKIVSPHLTWRQALEDNMATGEVDVDLRTLLNKGDPAVRSVLTVSELATAHCFSLYNWFVFVETKDKRVYVPKGAIATIRQYIAMKVRDANTFQQVVAKSKQVLAQYNVPVDMMADAVTHVAILGFFSDIDSEAGALARAIEQHEGPIKAINSVLKFELPWLWTRDHQLAAGAVCIAFLFAAVSRYWILKRKVETKQALDEAWQMASVFSSLLNGFKLWVSSLLSKFTTKFTLPTLASTARWIGNQKFIQILEFARMIPETYVENHNPRHYVDICNAGRKLTKIDASARVREAESAYCEAGFGLIQFGVGIERFKPVISRSCVHNELVATVNRGLLAHKQAEDLDDDDMEEFEDAFKRMIYKIDVDGLVVDGRLRPMRFGAWVKRFPPARRSELIQAREDIKIGHYRTTNRVKAFVKREHVLKSNPLESGPADGVEFYDPRLIQGSPPVYQVLTGPITYAMTKYVSYILHPDVMFGRMIDPWDNRRHTYIIYASGSTAESLGQWFHTELARLSSKGQVVFYKSDQSRFDARCHEHCMETKHQCFYVRFKVRGKSLEALRKMHHTHGFTSHGVEYWVNEKVSSGKGDTSVGDSGISIAGTEVGRKRSHTSKKNLALASRGDDLAGVLLRKNGVGFAKELNKFWDAYGFKVEAFLMSSYYDLEFCSGRFYPTSDGLIFGPKPGRIICKTFYSKIPYNNHMGRRWLLSVCLGLRLDVNFIPVVRVIIRRQLEILQAENLETIELPYEEQIHAVGTHDANDETFMMFEHLYGLDKSQVLGLEDYINRNLTHLPCTINHPLLDQIVAKDVGDYEPETRIRLASIASSMPQVAFAGVLLLSHPARLSPGVVAYSDFWVNCFFGPIWEEAIKGAYPWVALPAFLVLEYVAAIARLGIERGTLAWAPSAVIHLLCTALYKFFPKYGKMLAVYIHSAFNTVITIAQTQSRLQPLNFAYAWHIAAKAWAKLMHSLIGNMSQKSRLHEMCQKKGWKLEFFAEQNLQAKEMATAFIAEATVTSDKAKVNAVAYGCNKKAAQTAAAEALLDKLEGKTSVQEPPAVDGPTVIRKLLFSHLSFDYLFIDADQCHPPQPVMLDMHVKQITVAGVVTNVTPWVTWLNDNRNAFPATPKLIKCAVPVRRDAADDVIVRLLNQCPGRDTLLITGDKGLAARAIKLDVQVCATLLQMPYNLSKFAEHGTAILAELIALSSIHKQPPEPPHEAKEVIEEF